LEEERLEVDPCWESLLVLGYTDVEAKKKQPAQGMQKPPAGLGKNGSWAFTRLLLM
jgi:hypothetical protein